MKYLSVCSGIEAATVAWHPLGWKPEAFSEIEKFPSQVLKHHYPGVPNLGDMTKFEEWNLGTINLLVGGTPCQSFSVAGLRKGLDDPRGNLMLTYGAIANRFRPRWLVWENVPGVLSSNGGRDFGSFLGMLGELGYGWAYRVLDAQYFGVAQRRRRVFVVGYLGNWRRAAAVLFERHSLQGHPAPSRKKGQEVAGTFTARAKSGGWGQDPNLAAGGYMRPVAVESVSPTLTRRETGVSGVGHNEDGWYVTTARMVSFGEYVDDDTASAMKARDYKDATDLVAQPAAVATDLYNGAIDGDVTHSLRAGNGNAMGGIPSTITAMQVRRLTPVECERLQGFPDNYTNIPKAADGPRYKALGNSMAVPVMAWIGKRIQQVDAIQSNKTADCRVDA